MSVLKHRAKDRHNSMSVDELVLKEQARVAGIMNTPEAESRWQAAAELATSSSISLAEARSILALVPEGNEQDQAVKGQFEAMLEAHGIHEACTDRGNDYANGQHAAQQFLETLTDE